MTEPAAKKTAEFDPFADQYASLHAENVKITGEEPAYFAESKVREIAKRITSPVETILDFGAGVGGSIPYFRKYFIDAALYCVDVSAESLSKAEAAFGKKARYFHADGNSVPLETESVDIAFAACVFHHIPEREHESALREIRRVLKPGGQFFLFEHNPLNPLTVHAVNTCPFDENAVLIRAPEMRKRLKNAGFSCDAARFTIFFPAILSKLRGLETHLHWLPAGAQYYLEGRKA